MGWRQKGDRWNEEEGLNNGGREKRGHEREGGRGDRIKEKNF